jgi:hypothetical protein
VSQSTEMAFVRSLEVVVAPVVTAVRGTGPYAVVAVPVDDSNAVNPYPYPSPQ